MNAFVLQTLLLLAIVFVVGVLIGLLLRRWRRGARRPPNGTALPGATGAARQATGVSGAEATARAVPPPEGHVASDTGEQPTPDAPARSATPGAPLTGGETVAEQSKAADEAQAAPGEAAPAASEASQPSALAMTDAAAAGASTSPAPPEDRAGEGSGLSAAPEDAAHPGRRPPKADAPQAGGADNLKLLKGIGPQNEERLHGLGIFYFRQIADWTEEEARWVGSYLAFPGRIEREDWIGQAKALLAGTPPEDLKRPSPRRRN